MTTVLREELSRREWAQADLARVLNWPVQAMSEIMQGKRRVHTSCQLIQIATEGENDGMVSPRRGGDDRRRDEIR